MRVRKLKAVKHLFDVIKQCSLKVFCDNQTPLSDVYNELNVSPQPFMRQEYCNIQIVNKDIISVVNDERNLNHKVLVLNAGSFKTPGGNFKNGSLEQEELLCHCTNLYPALLKETDWYLSHRKIANCGLYNDDCIVSHNVSLLFDSDFNPIIDACYSFGVLTCSPVNLRTVLRNRPYMQEYAIDVMAMRIANLLGVASDYNDYYDTLILNAFGCKIGGHSPNVIAKVFKDFLDKRYRNCFKSIIFAIPEEKYYTVFDKILP